MSPEVAAIKAELIGISESVAGGAVPDMARVNCLYARLYEFGVDQCSIGVNRRAIGLSPKQLAMPGCRARRGCNAKRGICKCAEIDARIAGKRGVAG